METLSVFCANCGKSFGKYGLSSEHEMTCPKCKCLLRIETHPDHQVSIRILEMKEPQHPAGPYAQE